MGDENAIVKAYENKAAQAVVVARSVAIVDDDTRKRASALSNEIKDIRKEIEGRRTEITGPINQSLKKINAMFNGLDGQFAEAQQIVDGEIKRDWLDFEAARIAAQETLNANPDDPDFIPTILPETEKTVKTDFGSTTIRKDIKVSVISPKDVVSAVNRGELPMTLISFDLGAAKRYFKAAGIKQAPGFLIEDDAIVAGRK